MVLEDVFFVAQIISGVAVTASLIYVGIQVRQNTRSTKLAAVQALQTAMLQVEELIIRDAGFAEILKHGLTASAKELPDTDRIRLHVFYRNALRTYQGAHYQYRQSALDRSVWESTARTLAALFQADKGLREHFAVEKYMLDPSFVEFCEVLLKKNEQWTITSGDRPAIE